MRRYGAWMRAEAQKRIGHLYPPVEITAEMASERPDLKPLVGQKLTVIAWLWARTVKSPNPAFSHVDVPLASTFILSSKEGKEAYVQPVVEGDRYRFTVKMGTPPPEAEERHQSSGAERTSGALSRMRRSAATTSKPRKGRSDGRHELMAVVAEGCTGPRLSCADGGDGGHRALRPSRRGSQMLRCLQQCTWLLASPIYGLDEVGATSSPRGSWWR